MLILFDRVTSAISASAPRDRKMESKCARCETKLLRLARRRTITADITRSVRRRSVRACATNAKRGGEEILRDQVFGVGEKKDSRLVA